MNELKNSFLKISLQIIFMSFNFVLLVLFMGWIWKAAFIYGDGIISLDFNNYGEMYFELILSICLLIALIPVSLYIIKEHFYIFKKYK